MAVKNRFAELLPEITGWRRDFHAHPELLFDVHRTAARVAELCTAPSAAMRSWTGIGHTGVVAVIKGQAPTARAGSWACAPTWTRCRSRNRPGWTYASKTPGKMHACGHDGHTAMLLGAAKYLAETRNFDGSVGHASSSPPKKVAVAGARW